MVQFLGIARVAAAYAGTVIGAGFASGQELLQFFVSFGPIGLLSMLLTGLLFAFLGSRILELGYQLRATSYHHLLHYVCGHRLGTILDWGTAVFLFGGLCVMLSGSGAVCRDYFGFTYWSGTVVMAAITTVAAIAGVRGISLINLIVIPLLISATLSVSFSSIAYHQHELLSTLTALPPQPQLSPVGHWLPACLLYVSYNILLGATLLAPLGRETPERSARLWGGIWGGIILAVLGLLIMLVIMLHYPEVLTYEVPMLYVSNAQHGLNQFGYAAMLLKAMFSTAMASLYACTTKLQSATRLPYAICLTAAATAALAGSQFGFASLVSVLYPLFGCLALFFTAALFWQVYRDRK